MGCGVTHEGAEGHKGDVDLASQLRRLYVTQVIPTFQGFQLFNSTLAPGGHLGRNSFLPTPFAESGWEGKSDGELPEAPLWAQGEVQGSPMVPTEFSSSFRLKLWAINTTPCLWSPTWRTLLI